MASTIVPSLAISFARALASWSLHELDPKLRLVEAMSAQFFQQLPPYIFAPQLLCICQDLDGFDLSDPAIPTKETYDPDAIVA